jgi:hypothetical protein
VFHQLVYQRFARNHDSIATPVGDQVEFALDKASDRTMTDASGALVNDRRKRAREASQPGGGEGRGDAVECHHVRTLFVNLPRNALPSKRREWKTSIGERNEGESRVVRGCCRGHAPVIKIATSERIGITECSQSDTE